MHGCTLCLPSCPGELGEVLLQSGECRNKDVESQLSAVPPSMQAHTHAPVCTHELTHTGTHTHTGPSCCTHELRHTGTLTHTGPSRSRSLGSKTNQIKWRGPI